MAKLSRWWSTEESRAERVLADLRKSFTVVSRGNETLSARCLETFDWRLLHEGIVMLEFGRPRRLALCRVHDRSILTQVRFTAPKEKCFWQDLPPGELRDQARRICGVRALLSCGRFKESRETFDLRNNDDKTICRLSLEKASANGRGSENSLTGFRVIPLKGYETEAGEVIARLTDTGCRPRESWTHPAMVAFASAGREAFDYSSKTDLTLPPGVTAADACRRIHLSSLDVAERNLPGLLADLDTEFLHDFRVALRRSRSALQLVKGVFPSPVEKRYLKKLASLQKATNRLRDLDVHLIERESLETLLPPELHEGLSGLFEQIARERQRAFTQCRKHLERPKTRAILKEWREFLEKQPYGKAPLAGKPAVKVGRRLLRKRFMRILRDGRAIIPDSPDQALHRLRLQCKKLRYLLEFFGSLFPPEDTAFLVRRFRKLQNILGRFNDLCNQEAWARRRLEAANGNQGASTGLAASLGGLLSELARARRTERARFGRAFARLDTPEMRHKADQLFGAKKPKKGRL